MGNPEFNGFTFLNGFVGTEYFIEENKHATIIFIDAKIIFAVMNGMQAGSIQEERKFIPIFTVLGMRKSLVDGINGNAHGYHNRMKSHSGHPCPE